MEYKTLHNGIKMPMLGLGTWDVTGRDGMRIIQDAVEVGYRLIDTAKMYGNEKMIGDALAPLISSNVVKREDLFITTKLNSSYTSNRAAQKGIEESLKNFKMDYIDLYLIHEPYSQSVEMYKALEEYYRKGVIKAIGVSNFKESFFKNFVSKVDIVPMLNQVECHPYFQQKSLKKVLDQTNTAMEAWAPFTEGRRNPFREGLLIQIGGAHQKSAAQVILRYLIQKDIIVIPKSSRKERLEENFDVFDFELTPEEISQIEKMDGNQSLFGWY